MKNFIILAVMFLGFNAFATIEHDASDLFDVTAEEIQNNRSCFAELESNGCGDPGEETKHFRSCMSHVYPKLTPECQKLMTKLYKQK